MKLLLVTILSLLTTTSFANKEIIKDATMKLKASGIEEKAVSLGMKIPNFKVDGKNISDIYKKGPTVVKFYRGGWCPYCMTELKEYQGLLKKFESASCQIVALAPDLKKEISKTKRKHGLTFDIYRDEDNKIAKKFGLAFKLDKRLLPIYKKYGIELEKSQGNKNNELPMPGTYVVDKEGTIKYAFFDADYTKRAPANEVLKECQKLK